MKLLVFLLAVLSGFNAFAASGGTRGGGFVDFSPKPRLLELKTDLARRIRVLPASGIKELEVTPEWTPQRIADVIDNLELNSSAGSLTIEDDGRLKILDFNKERNSISVLAGFFLYFGRDLSRQTVDEETIKDVQLKLIHEAAHLWDLDDEHAHNFAERLLWLLHADAATCNVNRYGKPVHVVYSFGNGQTYHKSGNIGMSDDDALPGVMPAKDWFMSQAATNRVEGDKLVIEGYDFKMTMGRTVDDEYVTEGTYQYKKDGAKEWEPVQTVRCMLPTPR